MLVFARAYGKRHMITLLRCDGGLCLLAKRLEKGRFAWPRADAGMVQTLEHPCHIRIQSLHQASDRS
ncbi:IS66 family insertion sequence element accessory protein TnpB [Paraburkholderia sp. GAS41]|uniref:IS66 family insertion sequence element accessory protein TnpB n=1 Tax=Paraburkholderia sp. GAS41 TaxID=3035134 RepID=UPI003D1DB256